MLLLVYPSWISNYADLWTSSFPGPFEGLLRSGVTSGHRSYINANNWKTILYDYCRVPNLTAYARLNRIFNIDNSKQEIVVAIAIASNSKTKLNVDH